MAKATRSLVLGTAGHIDHGKTSLVRALTGTETDRLPEEKRRGITIALGFAPWEITSDLQASIVDVPGHENFVRTMVAGAGGIDAVILVVSAEDGVMPQTREHINVCRLLGVEHGVVALSKVDRLEGDEEAIELAADDVREALTDTIFESAPIVPCSAHTKAGLDELTRTVKGMVAKIPRRDSKGDVILPLDRVFSMKGHGTVVTGTLLRGSIELGKENALELLPGGEHREARPVRARAAQVRGSSTQRIRAGSRVALNLGGIETKELSRGDVLSSGPATRRASVFHAWLEHVPGHGAPWQHGASLEVCVGTGHAIGRLDPLVVRREDGDSTDAPKIGPGQAGLARIRLDQPLPIWRDARVIVRAFSDSSSDYQGRTVGGGTIIDPAPSSGRGQRPRWVALGQALQSPELIDRVRALIEDAGALGVGLEELVFRCGVLDLRSPLDKLSASKRPEVARLGTQRLVSERHVAPLVDIAIAAVDRFHADNPMGGGLSRAALEGTLGARVASDVAGLAIGRAIERGALRVVDDKDSLARPGKGIAVGGELPERMLRVLEIYEREGICPPTLKEVAAEASLGPREVLDIVSGLHRSTRLVKVTADLSFAKKSHDDLLARVRERLGEAGTIDVQALKGMTGLSRKFVVPFLEHLDQLQITLRQGDRRIPGPRA